MYQFLTTLAAFVAIIFAFYQGYKFGKGEKKILDGPIIVERVKNAFDKLLGDKDDFYDIDERNEEILMENIDNHGTKTPQKDYLNDK
jgi:hypothetical protein